jgi:hypothetical protein
VKEAQSQLLAKRTSEVPNPNFIASVKSPLLDAFRSHEPGLNKHSHMLAHGRLTKTELLRNEQPTDPILFEVAVDLRPEMASRLFEPLKDLKTSLVVERPKRFSKLGPNFW